MLRRVERQCELLDAESVVGQLLPAGGCARVELFVDLFPSGRGRPSVPSPVIATVLVLQVLHGLSDRDAADAVRFDLRWKTACGLAVTDAGFHATVLTYWRRRLAASVAPQRIFDAVRDVVTATGALRGRTRRALDSRVGDDAVAASKSAEQSVFRRVPRVVPGGARGGRARDPPGRGDRVRL